MTPQSLVFYESSAEQSMPKPAKAYKAYNARKTLPFALLLSVSSLLTGCNDANNTPAHSTEATSNNSAQASAPKSNATDTQDATTSSDASATYKVYTDADGTPFTFRDEKGLPTGFDIDVMNAIAEDQHFAVTYEILPWSLILPSIADGKADLAIGHISITDERRQTHNFSDAYYTSYQAALLKPELAQITSFNQLADKRVQVLKGSVQETLMSQMNIATTSKDNVFPMVKDLVNDKADALVLDNGILQYYQQQQADKNFRLIEDKSLGEDPYGIVVKKDNAELLVQVNQGLANIRQNGKYQQIEQKWFK